MARLFLLIVGVVLIAGRAGLADQSPTPSADPAVLQESATADEQPLAPVPPQLSVTTASAEVNATAEPTEEDPSPTTDATLASSATELAAEAPAAKPPAKKPPANPHKGVYYDNDFRYLDDPCNPYCYLGDFLKRRHLGKCLVIDVGGEFRLRQHNENILLRNDNFLLERTRIYGDLHYDDRFRVYVEAIDANRDWGDLPPRPIEVNRFDALNLFGDAKVYEDDLGKMWLRGGRQELLYGAQRLISPLDWANTRRTFDGGKMFWRGKDWDVDGFWTRPVPVAQHLTDHRYAFDAPDPQQEFYGVYATRKNLKDQKIEAYYLRLAKYDGAAPFDTHTLGGRWEGKVDAWLWEVESAYQFGANAGLAGSTRPHSAGFYTLGGGRKLVSFDWNPVVWVYFDWASGSRDPTSGTQGTFNQLFPLGHKYLGYMDIVGRQNIEDLNVLFTLNPTEKIELLAWYHIFHLQQARDALYDAAGTPIRIDPTGAAGTDVGQELDLTVRWTFRPRADVLLGYSHLFPGSFLLDTAGGAPGRDFYYTQLSVRF